MYGSESWTVKKAECQRIDAFELWGWRRLLKVPWTPRRSNQSILKEITPGCSLEGLMLKLKRQHFGHLMWRADSFEKTLMLGKIEGRRRKGWQRRRWMDVITDPMDMGVSGLQQLVIDREAWRAVWFMRSQRVRHNWVTELSWTECVFRDPSTEGPERKEQACKCSPYQLSRKVSWVLPNIQMVSYNIVPLKLIECCMPIILLLLFSY